MLKFVCSVCSEIGGSYPCVITGDFLRTAPPTDCPMESYGFAPGVKARWEEVKDEQ